MIRKEHFIYFSEGGYPHYVTIIRRRRRRRKKRRMNLGKAVRCRTTKILEERKSRNRRKRES